MSEYFVALNGIQQGPFPVGELVGRGMRPESLVWREGMTEWQRADSMPELAPLFIAPHPPTYSAYVQPEPMPAAHLNPIAPPQRMEYARPYREVPTSGLAIASLVLGILALIPCMSWLIIPCAILAVALGSSARAAVRRGEVGGGGMALAGVICGTISLCIIAVGILMFALIGFHVGSWFYRFRF